MLGIKFNFYYFEQVTDSSLLVGSQWLHQRISLRRWSLQLVQRRIACSFRRVRYLHLMVRLQESSATTTTSEVK